jgi:anti-sigma B factor antagonist
MTATPEMVAFDITVQPRLSAAVVRPHGDLTDAFADRIRETLFEVADEHLHLVVDLQAVRIIEPDALSLLVRTRQRVKESGGLLVLAAPSRFVLTVLHTMRLEVAFPTCPDTPAALDAIAKQRGSR